MFAARLKVGELRFYLRGASGCRLLRAIAVEHDAEPVGEFHHVDMISHPLFKPTKQWFVVMEDLTNDQAASRR